MVMIAGVYKITRVKTGQCYIGSSAWMQKRWTTHKRQLNKNEHQSPYLQNSWSMYGAASFEFSILEICDGEGDALKNLLFVREQYWMDFLKPSFNTCPAAASTLGYQMPREIVERHRQQITGRKLSPEHAAVVRGLALGLKRTPEKKEKQRQAGIKRGMPAGMIENSANLRRGKKLSPEHVEKIRVNSTGRKHSPETIAKMKAYHSTPESKEQSSSMRGTTQSPEHIAKRIAAMLRTKEANKNTPKALAQFEKHRILRLGAVASEETRAKMSLSHLARWERQKERERLEREQSTTS